MVKFQDMDTVVVGVTGSSEVPTLDELDSPFSTVLGELAIKDLYFSLLLDILLEVGVILQGVSVEPQCLQAQVLQFINQILSVFKPVFISDRVTNVFGNSKADTSRSSIFSSYSSFSVSSGAFSASRLFSYL